MTLSADAAAAKPTPGWHLWLSPSGRWFAARTAPLDHTSPMIISAATRDELDINLANAVGA